MSIEVPWEQLSPVALRGLVEEYVSREGTEYGDWEVSLERKVEQVIGQLRDGTAVICYDPDTGSTGIVAAAELRGQRR